MGEALNAIMAVLANIVLGVSIASVDYLVFAILAGVLILKDSLKKKKRGN
jgi:hypothetical protein